MIFRLLPDRSWPLALAALSLTGALSGCIVIGSRSEYATPRHEFRSVDREPLDHLKVRIRMGAGHLLAGFASRALIANTDVAIAHNDYPFIGW